MDNSPCHSKINGIDSLFVCVVNHAMVKYLKTMKDKRIVQIKKGYHFSSWTFIHIDEQDNCAFHFGPWYYLFALKPCIVMKFSLPIVQELSYNIKRQTRLDVWNNVQYWYFCILQMNCMHAFSGLPLNGAYICLVNYRVFVISASCRYY